MSIGKILTGIVVLTIMLLNGPQTLAQLVSGEEFHQLCTYGTVEQVQAALKAGASVAYRDKYGRTPLMVATISNKNPTVITILLEAGADVKTRDNDGKTTLMLASGVNPNPEVFTILLKAGASLNDRSKEGWTPLMWAAGVNPNPGIITALLNAGADAKAQDQSGKTAFDYADMNDKLKGTEAYWALNNARY